jgi:hypothetical protein
MIPFFPEGTFSFFQGILFTGTGNKKFTGKIASPASSFGTIPHMYFEETLGIKM